MRLSIFFDRARPVYLAGQSRGRLKPTKLASSHLIDTSTFIQSDYTLFDRFLLEWQLWRQICVSLAVLLPCLLRRTYSACVTSITLFYQKIHMMLSYSWYCTNWDPDQQKKLWVDVSHSHYYYFIMNYHNHVIIYWVIWLTLRVRVRS